MIEYDEGKRELTIRLLVVPRASRTEIKGVHGGAVRVRVAAPPVEGAANSELIKFLSKLLDIGKSELEIRTGSSSRRKTLVISGISSGRAEVISRVFSGKP